MQVLNQQAVSKVAGGETNCTYAGQSYSTGAIVSIGGGWVQACQSGGGWSNAIKLF